MKNFLIVWWPQILVVIPIFISLLNGITKHYSNYTGLAKFCGWCVEVLSCLVSYDVPGLFKAPFTSKTPAQGLVSEAKKTVENNVKIVEALSEAKKEVKDSAKLLSFLVLILFVGGCSTLGGKLEAASTATQLAASLGADTFHIRCTQLANECKSKGDTECISWIRCDKNRGRFKIAIIGVQDSLKIVNEILHTEGIVK